MGAGHTQRMETLPEGFNIASPTQAMHGTAFSLKKNMSASL